MSSQRQEENRYQESAFTFNRSENTSLLGKNSRRSRQKSKKGSSSSNSDHDKIKSGEDAAPKGEPTLFNNYKFDRFAGNINEDDDDYSEGSSDSLSDKQNSPTIKSNQQNKTPAKLNEPEVVEKPINTGLAVSKDPISQFHQQ